mmetsp:Transcript_77495/g.151720  ORF Transcript_77495/g.151720 Transcript_77495/m.151720 type:complete len:291 (+) Transcript_77495:25-897(+)
MAATAAAKYILVTGGNAGIGLALSKLLATDHSCHVFLGARDLAKGEAARDGIVSAFPAAADKIEVVQIDVSDNYSVTTAAGVIKAKGVTLYAVVNNAGIGLAHGDVGGAQAIMNTNYLGPKRVTETMVGLVDPTHGRIVNTSSGVASMWLRDQDAATKALFSNPDLTQEALDAATDAHLASGNVGMGGGYGLSKAALSALTLVQAKAHPQLKVLSLSPGFIDTNMTRGFGAKLTPEQGCVSALRCLFGDDVVSGAYYGSDGLRSPLTCSRDPGTPEYRGEADPDPAVYNN